MSFLLCKLFDGFVELFVLLLAFLFLKPLDLLLLLKEICLDLSHMLICFDHFCHEVIRTLNRYLGLHTELHGLLHVFSGEVVERYLPLDIVVDLQRLSCLRQHHWVLVGNSHVLGEGDSSLLFDQLPRF